MTSGDRPRSRVRYVRRSLVLVLLFVALTAATCEENDGGGGNPPPDDPGGGALVDPRTDDTGETPTCGSAGTSCMVRQYEDGEFAELFDETELLLATPDLDDDARARVTVFNTMAALRLKAIPVDSAAAAFTGVDRSQLDAASERILDEGLLEVFVVLEDGDRLIDLMTDVDESVLEVFYLRRPELIFDLEDLVPAEFEDQLPVTPGG